MRRSQLFSTRKGIAQHVSPTHLLAIWSGGSVRNGAFLRSRLMGRSAILLNGLMEPIRLKEQLRYSAFFLERFTSGSPKGDLPGRKWQRGCLGKYNLHQKIFQDFRIGFVE